MGESSNFIENLNGTIGQRSWRYLGLTELKDDEQVRNGRPDKLPTKTQLPECLSRPMERKFSNLWEKDAIEVHQSKYMNHRYRRGCLKDLSTDGNMLFPERNSQLQTAQSCNHIPSLDSSNSLVE